MPFRSELFPTIENTFHSRGHLPKKVPDFSSFLKLLKPLVKIWRSEAKTIVVYLDDCLGAATDSNKAKIASLQVHTDLLKAGFLPNETKCVWDPTQVITWLGAVLNTKSSEISATERRVNSLDQDLAFIFHSFFLFSPSLQDRQRLRQNESLRELHFRKSNLPRLNGIPIWPVNQKPSKIVCSTPWAQLAAASSSRARHFIKTGHTLRKSKAQPSETVSLSPAAFIESLKSQSVTWSTDNQNVVHILNSGSKVPRYNN